MLRSQVSAAAVVVALLVGACGGSGSTSSQGVATGHHSSAGSSQSRQAAHARPSTPLHLVYRPLYTLPAPLRDPAYAWIGTDRYVLVGGLDASDTSTDEIDVGNLRQVSQVARIGTPQHDAQAATLSSKVYVFGGGSLSELDHIISFDPRAGTTTTVDALPSAASDVAVASIGHVAYVVGGYDGTNWENTILSYSVGAAPQLVGRLPVGLRYAAVTAADGKLLIIGGTTAPDGTASNAIYSFDPATRRVTQIASLPAGVCHAEAASLGGYVYLVGGRGTSLSSQTGAIWAINPATGALHRAGTLPVPVSDAAVMSNGRELLLIGGLESTGATSAAVGALTPAGA